MVDSRANDFQYIFLGGILGEVLELPFVGNYLRENKKILERQNITHIDCITLSSLRSADENAKELVRIIEDKFLLHKKKIVIFCHSKGCLEAILAITEDILLFETAVQSVVCVQPPFQGSSLLSHILELPLLSRWQGLKSLGKGHYQEKFEAMMNDNDIRSFLESKLIVVKSFTRRSRDVSWVIRPTHFLFKRLSKSRSDGLVEFSEQSLPQLSCREVLMEMDHSDPFTAGILSSKDSQFRLEFMERIINDEILSVSALSPGDSPSSVRRSQNSLHPAI